MLTCLGEWVIKMGQKMEAVKDSKSTDIEATKDSESDEKMDQGPLMIGYENEDVSSSHNEIKVIGVDTITVQQPGKRTRLCPSFLQIYPTLTDKDSKGTGRFILKNIFRIVSYFTSQFEITGCQKGFINVPFIALVLHHLYFLKFDLEIFLK